MSADWSKWIESRRKKSIRDNRKTAQREFCKFPVLNHLFPFFFFFDSLHVFKLHCNTLFYVIFSHSVSALCRFFSIFFLTLQFLHYFAYDITTINDKTHNHSRLRSFVRMCEEREKKTRQHCIASMHFCLVHKKYIISDSDEKESRRRLFSFSSVSFTTEAGVRRTTTTQFLYFFFRECHE